MSKSKLCPMDPKKFERLQKVYLAFAQAGPITVANQRKHLEGSLGYGDVEHLRSEGSLVRSIVGGEFLYEATATGLSKYQKKT